MKRRAPGRPRGSKTGSRVSQPKPFKLFVNEFDDRRGRVWAVKIAEQRRWHTAREVSVLVPVISYFSPALRNAQRQPFAWFFGEGVVTRRGDCLVITG